MVKMGRKKYAILALLVGAIIVLGVMHMGDNPDWTLPVSIRAQEIENLSVDIASQSISELTIRIKAQDVPVTIEPAAGVTFNIQGDVNATIQGTASISVDNATITVDVATVREKASEENKLGYGDNIGSVDSGSDKTITLFNNTLGKTVYVELLTAIVYQDPSETTSPDPKDLFGSFEFYDSSDVRFARIYINFWSDGYVKLSVSNRGTVKAAFAGSVVYRKS